MWSDAQKIVNANNITKDVKKIFVLNVYIKEIAKQIKYAKISNVNYKFVKIIFHKFALIKRIAFLVILLV